MSQPPFADARIDAIETLSADIRLFDLRPDVLPAPPGPGDHLAITTPSGLVRHYSLIPASRGLLRIAVKRVANSRGGSASLHGAAVGDHLRIGAPANAFALQDGPGPHLLIAGGIGITPMLSMIAALEARDADWRLAYLTRRPEDAAFRDSLLTPERKARVTLHHSYGDPEKQFDLWPLLALPGEGHVYCCGPAPLMEAVRSLAFLWPQDALHFESFAAPRGADNRPFRLHLARTGAVVDVAVDQTALEALRAQGIDAPAQCEAGSCGTCRVPVLDGEADHRDFATTPAGAARGFALCVSRAKGEALTLDL